jgi:hypothetical protein
MRFELLPGMTNVVRFPIEQRRKPSLDVLREIRPDSREVELAAEAFFLEDSLLDDIRGENDRMTAEHILNHVRPEPGSLRRAALDDLLKPLVDHAVDACRRAHQAAEKASTAAHRLVRAQIEGGYWIEPLNDEATKRAEEAARLLIEAHIASEVAEGGARAINIAKRGEEWKPFDLHAEEAALFFGAAST